VSRLVATLTNGSYRRALAAMRGHTTIGSLDARQALEDARRAAVASDTWQALGMRAALRAVPEAVAAREAFRAASDGVAALLSVFPSMTGDALPLARVGEWLDRLPATVTPTRLLRMQDRALRHRDVPALSPDRDRTPPPARGTRPRARLAVVVPQRHNSPNPCWRRRWGPPRRRGRVRALDRERLAAAIERVRRAHAERAVGCATASATRTTSGPRSANDRATCRSQLFARRPTCCWPCARAGWQIRCR
jgi:hypothetical protein